MGGTLFGAILAGGAAGLVIGLGLRAMGAPLLRIAVAAGVLAGTLAFAFRLSRVTACLDSWWKRRTALRLRMAHLPMEYFRFAVLLSRREGPRAEDITLLAETHDALVFFGARDGMTVIRLSDVVGAPFPDGFFSAWWTCLELRDGSRRWILIREGGDTAWGRREATEAFAERIATRLADPRLLIPRWEERLRGQSQALKGLTAMIVPERVDELWKLGQGQVPPGVKPTREQLEEAARGLVAAALSLVLVDRGWSLSLVPRWSVSKDGVEFNPEDLLKRLERKELSAEDWRRTWVQAGGAEVDLGEFAARRRLPGGRWPSFEVPGLEGEGAAPDSSSTSES
ncbi:MAG: hypothetical protein HYZ53_26585 [Planctomycetes bacterium]|nr:hypothetical protein [Planctomycetota bacterium]